MTWGGIGCEEIWKKTCLGQSGCVSSGFQHLTWVNTQTGDGPERNCLLFAIFGCLVVSLAAEVLQLSRVGLPICWEFPGKYKNIHRYNGKEIEHSAVASIKFALSRLIFKFLSHLFLLCDVTLCVWICFWLCSALLSFTRLAAGYSLYFARIVNSISHVIDAWIFVDVCFHACWLATCLCQWKAVLLIVTSPRQIYWALNLY